MKKSIIPAATVLIFLWAFPCAGIALQRLEINGPVFTFDAVPEAPLSNIPLR
nr:hypothetical protein [Desulfobacula sp.]